MAAPRALRKQRQSVVAFAIAMTVCCANLPARAGEPEERRAIGQEAISALLGKRFGVLDDLATKYRTERSRTSSGVWKLSLFYDGIGDAGTAIATSEGPDTETIIRRTQEWAREAPNSPVAHNAYVVALISHAWVVRGKGYAADVKPEAWIPFRATIDRARQYLHAHKPVAAVDPRWYQSMFVVARTQGWDWPEVRSLIDEALGQEPLYYQNYFDALEYFMPKWGGSTLAVEEFVQDAVRRTSKQEGMSLYARLYWAASTSQFRERLFQDSAAKWPAMRAGFEAIVERYPNAWNLNHYAKFACLAGDMETSARLLARIGSIVEPQAWRPAASLDECRRRAAGR